MSPLDGFLMSLDSQAPSASGKRPRFALSAEQAERLALLREIDQQATETYQDAGAMAAKVEQQHLVRSAHTARSHGAGGQGWDRGRAAPPTSDGLLRLGVAEAGRR